MKRRAPSTRLTAKRIDHQEFVDALRDFLRLDPIYGVKEVLPAETKSGRRYLNTKAEQRELRRFYYVGGAS